MNQREALGAMADGAVVYDGEQQFEYNGETIEVTGKHMIRAWYPSAFFSSPGPFRKVEGEELEDLRIKLTPTRFLKRSTPRQNPPPRSQKS